MRARLLSLFLANQTFKIINRPIAGAHPARPAILTYSPASPTATDVSLSYNVASTVAQAAYPLSVEFYKLGIGNNPAQFIGRDTLLAAEAGSNKSVVFTVPAGIVLDSETVILASASASDHRGSSEFSRYISLLSFVGNAPAYAGQTSTIRVRMQATGPFRPQGKVTISDDLLTNALAQRCVATLTPTASPFVAEAQCNLAIRGNAGNTAVLYAQYESDFDNFRNENDGQPTATRNISILAPLAENIFKDGFESL